MYKKGDKMLLNNKFLIKGNTLIYNKIKNKKRLYRYPCEIIKILGGGFYNIKLSVNYSSVGIKKIDIYKVSQNMLKNWNILKFE